MATQIASRRRLDFRIGVNLSDVVVSGEDLLGIGVNVAARLQKLTASSGNSISAAVCEDLDGKVPYASTSDRRAEPEDIPRPIFVFRVDWRQDVSLDGKVGVSPALMARRGADQPSIVVMPFDNLSGQDEEYFVGGVVEEITAALSRVRDFFVIKSLCSSGCPTAQFT